jgi:hypothetical protein
LNKRHEPSRISVRRYRTQEVAGSSQASQLYLTHHLGPLGMVNPLPFVNSGKTPAPGL